jgi:hypothetical protein
MEGEEAMRLRAALLLGAMALAIVVVGGVALAATISCTTNPCNGTDDSDEIFGSSNPETINALGGSDFVDAFPGDDTVNGDSESDNRVVDEGGTLVKGLIGAENSDTVNGNGGSDYIDLFHFDNPGTVDRANGGPGNDTVDAFDGDVDIINCGKGKRDKVYYDKGIDAIKGCEKKHPDEAPPAITAAEASTAEHVDTPQHDANALRQRPE